MPSDDDPNPSEDSTSNAAGSGEVFPADSESMNAPIEPHADVLSGAMDGHDPESTGELDLPEPDDEIELHPASSDPGFDGWLDGEQGAEGDPYAALADDDAAEIADWVAFTSGANAEEDDPVETDVVIDVTDDSVETDVTSADADTADDQIDAAAEDTDVEVETDPDTDDDDAHEDTIEFFLDGDDGDGAVAEVDDAVEAPDTSDEPAASAAVAGPAADADGAVAEVDDAVEAPDTSDEPAASAAVAGPAADAESATEPAAFDQPKEADDDVADTPVDDSGGQTDDDADAPEATAVDGSSAGAVADDRDQLTVLPVVPITAARDGDDAVDVPAPDNDDGDDTGEIPVIGAAAAASGATADEPAVFDFSDHTDEHYVQTATRDHQDLAAAIDQADSENTEQVAISAAIPGLESGVVGFDDVVAADGDATPAAPRRASNLLPRVGTGIALVAAFLLSLLWRPAITVLALAAFVVAAGEFYSALMHRRYKPMSIFGFVGIIAAGLGAVVWGVIAIPITFALMATVILLYGAVSQRRIGAVSGFALTLLVAGWIGGFGSFAFPIIAAEEFQVLVLTVVALVALVDIAAYFVGSSIGRRPFAPTISPKKTIEGFVGGTFMAFLAGAAASFFVESIDLPTGLILGAAVAVFAPLGDLAVSVVKRSLDIKDMGSILPGHGGLLDRIDAIIAVVPAAWAVFVWAGLL